MLATVVIFWKSFDDIGFTYSIPENISAHQWMLVMVPWKEEVVLGVIIEVFETTTSDFVIKPIVSLYSSDIFLQSAQCRLIQWMAQYYFAGIHHVVGLFFPSNLLQKLQKRTFVWKKNMPSFEYTFTYNKILNSAQQEIFQHIIHSQKQHFLLYGVTWSGKTEIYIHLIAYYLKHNKQVLLLVPEIILTSQIFDRIQRVFWNEVFVLNSTVSDAKKTKYWESIYVWQAKVVVWTRSALFYPYNNLGLIIVDEEHDNSYISENTPRYDTIEVVKKMTELFDIKILLWSWTPKITHLYQWLKWEYEILNLFQEYTKKTND